MSDRTQAYLQTLLHKPNQWVYIRKPKTPYSKRHNSASRAKTFEEIVTALRLMNVNFAIAPDKRFCLMVLE